jgi:hypothetical protein
MNAINNSIYIAFLFVVSISLSFTITIGVNILDEMKDNLPWDLTPYENINSIATTLQEIFETSTNFLLAYLVMLSFVSSAVERQSVQSYLINFLGALIVSSLVLFLISNIYSYMIDNDGGLIDWGMMPDWFVNNFTYILVINVIAGLLSFLWVGSPLANKNIGGLS